MQKKNYFTLVEIMIVVAIIGLLAAIAVPNFMKARETSRVNACISNLKQISAAKEQDAMDNNVAEGGTSTAALNTYFNTKVLPTCPAGGSYTNGDVGVLPVCSLKAAGHELTP